MKLEFDIEFIKKIVYESHSKKEVFKKLNLSYVWRILNDFNIFLKENQIDISHFGKNPIIEKVCPKCSTLFSTYKNGKISRKFCSRYCANSHTHNDETKNKISESLKRRASGKPKPIKDIPIKIPKNKIPKIKESVIKKVKITLEEKIMGEIFEDISPWSIKRRVVLEQKGCCNKCGLDKWLEQPIILELEHKNGNHYDNSRENVEAICPNCHSLTDTWRGRNKKNIKLKITDEQLLDALLKNNFNMRQALLDVNLVPKGGNYKRCHHLKRLYESVVNNK
jgi:hypothetical protein